MYMFLEMLLTTASISQMIFLKARNNIRGTQASTYVKGEDIGIEKGNIMHCHGNECLIYIFLMYTKLSNKK